MRQLCKHDWVGDDDCAYCKGEEAEGLYMVMRRDFEKRGDIIVELEAENSKLLEICRKHKDSEVLVLKRFYGNKDRIGYFLCPGDYITINYGTETYRLPGTDDD